MIAAVYARKSTEQNGAGDKSERVERQIARARAYAAGRGWSVADPHVYADDGISGAEFGDRRPGLARLLNALRPPFQALVMSEESRLGRESIEVAYAIKTLAQACVRVFLYLDDRERTLDSPTDKILLSVAAYADELERERARQRTYDAMARKAERGHVTGGRVYGYDNVEVAGSDGRRLHVVRRINQEQAAVVRRVFALAAEGQGFTRIAKALNEDGVMPPRRASGWAPSAVREVLLRPLYRGEVVWNRKQKRDRWGRKRYLDRPEAAWLHLDAPELRIVPQDLWQAAQRRMEASRELYAAGGRSSDRPDQEEKYLLSGIATCKTCGGSLVAFTRDYKRGWGQRGRFYGCSFNHKRGAKVCANRILIRQDRLDQVVLDAIAEALDERLLERAVEKALQRLRRSPDRAKDRQAAIRAELPLLEARMRTVVDEIARARHVATGLRRRLGNAGISQTQLAKAAQRGVAQVSHLLAGKGSSRHIVAVAEQMLAKKR